MNKNHAFGDGKVWSSEDIDKKWSMLFIQPSLRKARKMWHQFIQNCRIGSNIRLGANAWVSNRSNNPESVVIGNNAICRGLLKIEEFGSGQIHIGTNCYLGDDTLISSACTVTLGSFVLVGHGTQIMDNDSHPLDAELRYRDYEAMLKGEPRGEISTGKIQIGNNVWIGCNCIILKGVNIGNNSVIAAGSVVTKSVDPDTMVGGNPANVIRKLI
jgi:acetyltransferase-like isoleucine patch superfamily enzyme